RSFSVMARHTCPFDLVHGLRVPRNLTVSKALSSGTFLNFTRSKQDRNRCEREEKYEYAEPAKQPLARGDRDLRVEDRRMTDGAAAKDEGEAGPEPPSPPEEPEPDENRQERGPGVSLPRPDQRVEDVPAIELGEREKVERGNEETEPRGE